MVSLLHTFMKAFTRFSAPQTFSPAGCVSFPLACQLEFDHGPRRDGHISVLLQSLSRSVSHTWPKGRSQRKHKSYQRQPRHRKACAVTRDTGSEVAPSGSNWPDPVQRRDFPDGIFRPTWNWEFGDALCVSAQGLLLNNVY